MQRTTNLIEMIPIFSLTLMIQLCTNRTKDVLHTNCITLRMTPNMGQNYITTWLHEKWTFRNRIGHNKLCLSAHDTYTKVLGCKTWINSPLMYTSMMKLLVMWPKQVLWLLHKPYDLSTYLFKIYWLITNNLQIIIIICWDPIWHSPWFLCPKRSTSIVNGPHQLASSV